MVVGSALFSNGGRPAAPSKALVEFRAGKMTMNGTTVTPDKRKGMVIVEQGEDDLMHFKWKDRTSGNIEDDLIIFPDDVEFKRVPQCTTGRVYILRFKSGKKLFFWLQEPKEDKDEENCKKVNEYLNNPPAAGSGGSGSRSGGGLGSGAGGIAGLDMANLRDSDLGSLLNHMSQQQLMQLFGEAGGLLGSGGSSTRQRSSARPSTTAASTTTGSSTTPSVTTTTAPASSASTASPAASAAATTTSSTSGGAASKAPIQLSDLQSILSGIKVPPGASGSSEPEVDLAAGLTVDVLQPLLENPDFVERMTQLLPEVPATSENPASEIRSTVQSPQFRQALSMFSNGLQSGQLAPLIREFGLGDEAVAAATAGDMEAFVKALQKNKDSKPKTDDEGMDLD